MKWNQGLTIAAAVVGSILILWSGKSEQPPSGWEPMQLGTNMPTIEQETSAVQSAVLGQNTANVSSNGDLKQTNDNTGLVELNQVSSAEGKAVEESTSISKPEPSGGTTVDTTEVVLKDKEIAPPEEDNSKINVNTAPAAKLTEIPGIGEKKAQAIIDYRNAHGPFNKVSDLTKVKGIGTKILEKMAPYVRIQ